MSFKPDFNKIGKRCAKKLDIDFMEIYTCANTIQGNNL